MGQWVSRHAARPGLRRAAGAILAALVLTVAGVATDAFAISHGPGQPRAAAFQVRPAQAASQDARVTGSNTGVVHRPRTTTTTAAPTTTTTVPPPPPTTTTVPPAPPPPPVVPAATPPPAASPPAPPPPPAATTSSVLPPRGGASAYGCTAALQYLYAYAAPGFAIQCPGNAWGHQAMTCVNTSPECPTSKIIAIADPCAAAYMNEASNSWVLIGQSDAPIDPYGYCT